MPRGEADGRHAADIGAPAELAERLPDLLVNGDGRMAEEGADDRRSAATSATGKLLDPAGAVLVDLAKDLADLFPAVGRLEGLTEGDFVPRLARPDIGWPVVADSERQFTHRSDSIGSLVRRTTQGSTV